MSKTGSHGQVPESSVSSQRDLVLGLTQNPNISKNQLWSRMQDAMSFSVAKERTSQMAGIGDKPKGAELRRITQAIHKDLDNELHETDFEVDDDMRLDLPDILWDTQGLRSHIKDMEGVDFWLQKGMNKVAQGKTDAAMDYYR